MGIPRRRPSVGPASARRRRSSSGRRPKPHASLAGEGDPWYAPWLATRDTMPVEPSQLMEKLTALCKRRGFIFQSSEIYGGINGAWDYGPLGAELKRNVKDAWWKAVVRDREDVVGLDSSILMHPMTWKASGHVSNFADPMVDCKKCKKRYRVDEIEPEYETTGK